MLKNLRDVFVRICARLRCQSVSRKNVIRWPTSRLREYVTSRGLRKKKITANPTTCPEHTRVNPRLYTVDGRSTRVRDNLMSSVYRAMSRVYHPRSIRVSVCMRWKGRLDYTSSSDFNQKAGQNEIRFQTWRRRARDDFVEWNINIWQGPHLAKRYNYLIKLRGSYISIRRRNYLYVLRWL